MEQPIAVPAKDRKRLEARARCLREIVAREGSRTPTGQLSQAELRALRSILRHLDHCPWGTHRPDKHVVPLPAAEA